MNTAAILAQQQFENLVLKVISDPSDYDFIIVYQEWDKDVKIEAFNYVQQMVHPILKYIKEYVCNFNYQDIGQGVIQIRHLDNHFAFLKIINKKTNASALEMIASAKNFEIRWIDLRYPHMKNYNGKGPIPGTAKYRGGPGFYRHPQTKRDMKQKHEFNESTQCWDKLHNRYIPNSWDDINRQKQRCWKEQIKGRKSWMK